MNATPLSARLRAARMAPLVLLVVLCGCGSSTSRTAAGGSSTVSSTTADAVSSRSPGQDALRTYLRAWEASWRRLGSDLGRVGEDDVAFSDTPDPSWETARRDYQLAANAYRHDERELGELTAPLTMRAAHGAYVAAVRRQESRFQSLADAFGGSDPQAMEQALESLEASQMTFDRDGARWARAVVAACKASGVRVPGIVRRDLISKPLALTEPQ